MDMIRILILLNHKIMPIQVVIIHNINFIYLFQIVKDKGKK
jgi:hypothetical protein